MQEGGIFFSKYFVYKGNKKENSMKIITYLSELTDDNVFCMFVRIVSGLKIPFVIGSSNVNTPIIFVITELKKDQKMLSLLSFSTNTLFSACVTVVVVFVFHSSV